MQSNWKFIAKIYLQPGTDAAYSSNAAYPLIFSKLNLQVGHATYGPKNTVYNIF
jgi:hypothetical protein